MTLRRPFSHRRAAMKVAIAVAMAVLLAQSLGLVHRISHGPGWHAATAAPAQGLDALFASHGDEGGCVLYDQLTHGDAAWSPPMQTLPALPPAAVPTPHRSWHIAAQARGFLARGPPAI